MKSYIPSLCLICIVQLWSCASQSDSFKQETIPQQENKGRALPKTTPKVEDAVEEEPEHLKTDETTEKPAYSEEESIVQSNKGKTSGEVNANSGGTTIQLEDKMEGTSIISYHNIIEKEVSKMPVQGQKVKLMIKNNHQYAMWYLMPVSGEKTMPSDGQFYANPEASPPFLVKQYGSANSKLIELIYHGKEAQSFRAFYIEAGSSLLFRNYDLGTYQEGEYVPFWAIKGLVVDDKINLEDWLPFSVVSSPNVVIHNTTESGAAKWIDMGAEAVFPKQKIHFVQASGIKKHQIPVGVIR
ncbi:MULTISPECIES: hypothetical protein [unclassified Aureispira]|uniref:hypothetical protein n=1 Tax=unclassified Aureispira TaxID=2649989 RepID=UPI000698ABD6|nr:MULTISPECIES: hypothetical protein [unclassified Aureispira]WMX13004.1 hypothetical protein QP953_19380 [Aureispira sp. CCB-E]